MKKVLISIDETEIDENGVYYVPDGIEIIEEIQSDKVKKIVFSEGVTTISQCSIYCPNLESIVLPSSLVKVGDSAFGKNKVKYENISFGNHTFLFGTNAFGYDTTNKYIDELIHEMYASINEESQDLHVIISILKNFDRVCYQYIDQTRKEQLCTTLYKLFENENVSTTINSLVAKKINNKEILSPSFLSFMCYKECKKQNIPSTSVHFSMTNTKIAAATEEGYIDFGISAINHFKRKTDGSPEEINAALIYTIFHEIQHVRQRYSGKNGTSLLSKIDYLDSIIQSTSDSYERGFGYSEFHDNSPDEIMADICAYESVLDFFENNPLISDTVKSVEYLKNRKEERIKAAHQIDENGVCTIPDFREYAYQSLLSRDNLSQEERKKVTNIAEIYSELKLIAEQEGIDLFEKTSTSYYNSKSNKPTK